MAKYCIHLVREYAAANDNHSEIPRDEKDLIIDAPSCAEACVLAKQGNHDYIYTAWKCIEADKPRILSDEEKKAEARNKKILEEYEAKQKKKLQT